MNFDDLGLPRIHPELLTEELFWEEWDCWWDEFMRKVYFNYEYTYSMNKFEHILQDFCMNLVYNNYVDEDNILDDLLDKLLIKLKLDYKKYLIESKIEDLQSDFA